MLIAFCVHPVNCCILQDFDPTSAFFTKAVNKKKKAGSDPTQSSKKDRGHERNGAHNGEEEVNFLTSRNDGSVRQGILVASFTVSSGFSFLFSLFLILFFLYQFF